MGESTNAAAFAFPFAFPSQHQASKLSINPSKYIHYVHPFHFISSHLTCVLPLLLPLPLSQCNPPIHPPILPANSSSSSFPTQSWKIKKVTNTKAKPKKGCRCAHNRRGKPITAARRPFFEYPTVAKTYCREEEKEQKGLKWKCKIPSPPTRPFEQNL